MFAHHTTPRHAHCTHHVHTTHTIRTHYVHHGYYAHQEHHACARLCRPWNTLRCTLLHRGPHLHPPSKGFVADALSIAKPLRMARHRLTAVGDEQKHKANATPLLTAKSRDPRAYERACNSTGHRCDVLPLPPIEQSRFRNHPRTPTKLGIGVTLGALAWQSKTATYCPSPRLPASLAATAQPQGSLPLCRSLVCTRDDIAAR